MACFKNKKIDYGIMRYGEYFYIHKAGKLTLNIIRRVHPIFYEIINFYEEY